MVVSRLLYKGDEEAVMALFISNRNTKSVLVWFFGALSLAFSVLAYPHHSAKRYDFDNSVEIQGKILYFDISNPHIDLILDVANSDGSTKHVRFEGHSQNSLRRNGWRPGMIRYGDIVTITIAPMRNGRDGGYIQHLTLADGTQF